MTESRRCVRGVVGEDRGYSPSEMVRVLSGKYRGRIGIVRTSDVKNVLVDLGGGFLKWFKREGVKVVPKYFSLSRRSW